MIKAPKGMRDVLPDEAPRWVYLEECIRETMRRFNYKEIQFPTFEETALFARSIGKSTDIVEKQMYTFTDAGKRSMTLTPEGTASVVRAYIEHAMGKKSPYIKLFYIARMYRQESPQAGRYRQHTQFGVEAIGSADPAQDVEIIQVLLQTLKFAGLKSVELLINTIGCAEDRAKYHKVLVEYLEPRMDKLCSDCKRRSHVNPLRVLDCKKEDCINATKDVPHTRAHLCAECDAHFEKVLSYLSALDVDFTVTPRLVRGLDYYTRTVFEVTSSLVGAQDSLGGGGRYDNLVEELGGRATPAAGFASGMERILIAMEKENARIEGPLPLDLLIAVLGDAALFAGMKLATSLRESGISCHIDMLGRTLRAQMRQANKLKARKVLIIGEDELKTGTAQMKDLYTGEQTEVPLSSPELVWKEVVR